MPDPIDFYLIGGLFIYNRLSITSVTVTVIFFFVIVCDF